MLPRALLILACLSCPLWLGCSRSPASMAQHFNELAAAETSEPERVVESLSIRVGDTVADIGAGGGFFTLKLAQAVGAAGRVFAVDIEQGYLDFIGQQLNRQGIENVELVLGTTTQSNLPQGKIDLVFVRTAFHDIADQVGYFSTLHEALAPNARVAIIDYEPAGLLSRLHGHTVSAAEVVERMQRAGYRLLTSHDFLAEQSFQIFEVAAEP